MNVKDIEALEKRYFDEIAFFVDKNIQWFLERLKSKNEIKKDWLKIFKATSREAYDKASELDKGAERVVSNMFGQYRVFAVNSSPIGSDLMFETPDAFIHLEVKTATDSNPADFKGKIQIAQNQTTYATSQTKRGNPYPFIPSLPTIYSNNKICLTYVIQIIHNNDEDLPKIIVLFSIPNGLLKSTYGNCVNSGKHAQKLNRLNSRGDIRFLYKDTKKFENLKDKPNRIKVIYPQNPARQLIKDFLGLEEL
ncbi:hypothetical protein COU55_02050 [Candidatus Pacearchaeota archaeon CG10_big_fil_rev_8_21_14_0_10_31_59]|nr:MAG: hypothetical protein COU55_02050 [Candidatus Pacearchaeota archaeon CG10_big_fil_rev_8_21_14_0_10_31_59]